MSTTNTGAIDSCIADRGTVIAVDYGHWGGPTVRGCVVHARSGMQLLHAAGFTSAGTEQDGNSFVCRLGTPAFHDGAQYPTASQQACVDTPPFSAYWSYWVAAPGGRTWNYSNLGSLADHPRPGGVELWNFGGTTISAAGGSGVPRIAPAALRAPAARAGVVDIGSAAPPTTGAGGGSGSAAPLVLVAVVVILIVAAAAQAGRRRRRGEV